MHPALIYKLERNETHLCGGRRLTNVPAVKIKAWEKQKHLR